MRLPNSPCLHRVGIAALLLTALASQAATAPDPKVVERIRAFETGMDRTPWEIMSIIAPDGKPVYLFTAPCCDHVNPLFDADGRFICAPSGGFSGAGDGKCPDWVHEKSRWRRLRLPHAATAASEPPKSRP